MKITSIHTHYVRIPFDMGAPKQDFAGLRFPTMDHLLVQVETDAGITGWGEGFGHTIIPVTKVRSRAIGSDPYLLTPLLTRPPSHRSPAYGVRPCRARRSA